ncbi:TMEM175 family protein [Propioniciclava soli]|uniref:TMEM175 family protein n=1 Tax=Propioniciclava soli TaxID=2775081 RepID=A0ABZ3C8S1_9ACTN
MTLLVLPLLESIPEAAAEHMTGGEWLEVGLPQLIGFAVSFGVVASFWAEHHRLFEHVRAYTRRLVGLNFAWMFTICFLQLPSAMVYSLPSTRSVIGLYIGTMTVSAVVLTLLVAHVHAHPEIQEPGHPLPRARVWANAAVAALFGLAFVIAMIAPQINYFALFVLFLSPVVERLSRRAAARRDASLAAAASPEDAPEPAAT